MKHLLLLLLVFVATSHAAAEEQVSVLRYLPLRLTNENTKVTFAVDSTWHEIHGTAATVEGEIIASEQGNVGAEVHLPVKSFDTGNGLRDGKLREVMAVEQQPEVVFTLTSFSPECLLEAVELEHPCAATAQGILTIRGVKKEITFPVSLIAHADHISLNGGDTLLWREYGVEDPSIMVARLAEKVAVHFEIQIPR